MKKVAIGIGVLLIIAGMSAPFVSGLIMEQVVRDTFANLNTLYAHSGQDVTAEIVRYDRGYSSSEIEWRIKFGKLKALYGIDEVLFLDQATHGITGIATKTSLEKNGWYRDFISSKLAGKDPLHIATKYTFAGGVESTTALDSFAIKVDQEEVTVKPAKLKVACAKDFKKFVTEGSWEGLVVAQKISMDTLTLRSDLTMISPYVWDGNVLMQMKNVKAQGEQVGDKLDLTNLKVNSFISFNKERSTVSAKAEYGVESLEVGPKKITDVFASFGINGVDVKGYESFMKLYTTTMGALLGDIAEVKDDPVQVQKIIEKKMAMMGFQLMAAGEKLLKKDLEVFVSELRARLPEGEIKGDVVLTLKKDMTFAQFVPVVAQPPLILDIFSLKSNFSLPEKIAGDPAGLYMPFYPGMATGLFVKNGENAQHKAETKDGKLFLNDKIVNLN